MKRKLSWRRPAAISLILATMGIVIGKVVDRQIFANNSLRSAAFIESLRPSRPEGVGVEDWNKSIDITVTVLCNVCTYDPKNDRSKKMIGEILSLKETPPHDSLGKLCKIWAIFYQGCSSEKKSYLDKYKKFLRISCV
jgi:hypothetical protein